VDLPAVTRAAEPVQVTEAPFHDPSLRAKAGAVPGRAPGDLRPPGRVRRTSAYNGGLGSRFLDIRRNAVASESAELWEKARQRALDLKVRGFG
jgi:hypothetical protein